MARLITNEDGQPILRDDWCLEDIIETAKLMKVRLSKKKAIKVMENLANTFDASVGINWDVIKANIDTILYLNGVARPRPKSRVK